MRAGWIGLALLLGAWPAGAADPIFLDQLIETPIQQLREHFPGLSKTGCYAIGEGRFVLFTFEKDERPWRVGIASTAPCAAPVTLPELDVRVRRGVELGDSSAEVLQKMGRPDTSAAPEPSLRQFGDREYFYLCRIEEFCARHTSVFTRGGVVSAVIEWYSN